jgi:hypothetical protein
MTDEEVVVEDMLAVVDELKDSYRTLILCKLLAWYEFAGCSELRSYIRIAEDKTEVEFRRNLNQRSVTITWEEER